MVKLLVVDQHPVLRKGLELIFAPSREIKLMGSVGDGEAIFDFIKKTSVDVILTEIDLPKLNALTALRRLNKEFPKIKVIIFSALPEGVYALSSIKAGAYGFIPKTIDVLSLSDAIIKVKNGGMFLSDTIAKRLSQTSKSKNNDAFYKKLSTREVEVLKLLSIGKRNKEV
ncbi:response regulator transcription factor, partial [Bizionia paragorgiae]